MILIIVQNTNHFCLFLIISTSLQLYNNTNNNSTHSKTNRISVIDKKRSNDEFLSYNFYYSKEKLSLESHELIIFISIEDKGKGY